MKETMNYKTIIRKTTPLRVAALAHRGDYNQIVATFQELAGIAANMKLFGPTTRSFGIYYDDPSATPERSSATAFETLPKRVTRHRVAERRRVYERAADFRAHRGPHLGCGTFAPRFDATDENWPAAATLA